MWAFLFQAHIVTMSLTTRRGRIHNLLRSTRSGLAPYLSQRNLVRAAAAAGQAFRSYRAARQGRAQNVTSGSAPLTGQFDYKTDYARRRKSKRQRRIGKRRFQRRRRLINTVRNSAVAPVHLVRRSLYEMSSIANASNAISFGMYGINGTSGDTFNTCDDVASIFKQMDEFSWNNSFNPVVPTNNHKLWFLHATLEMTIRNTGEQDALIEAYYIRGRQAINTAWGNPTFVYDQGFNRQNLAEGPARDQALNGATFERELVFSDIGVTPFQNSFFCKSYNIYKRQKFRIPPGGEINFVVGDRRGRSFNMAQCNRYATDSRYHGVLFQQQGSPDASSGVEVAALPTAVTYLATRRYRFKMMRDAMTQDAFDTAATTHGVPDPST